MISPLLSNAVEMFEHAIEHYMAGNERDRKLMVLHCDQAVELILKEKLRDLGGSIFLKNGQTIAYHDAMKTLLENKGIKIPEKPDLEILHDQRNVIQHKGAQVSPSDAEFYIRKSFDFFKRFLNNELGKNIEDMIDKRYLEVFNIEVAEIPLAQEDEREIEDISKILVHTREFEILAYKYLTSKGIIDVQRYTGLRLVQEIINLRDIRIKPQDLNKLKQFFAIRNKIAHTDYVPSMAELEPLVAIIRKLNWKLISKLENNNDG